MKLIVVINGPNLNLLGEREPEVYGTKTLDEINEMIKEHARSRGLDTIFHQSNHEGEIIDLLHKYRSEARGYILNPGAYAHYSYAIRDAVASIEPPVVEVHLSDISAREEFRQISVIAPVAAKQIYGKGVEGYLEAVSYLASTKENI